MDSRGELLQRLKRLNPAQFEQVLFRLGIDPAIIPSPFAEQSLRAIRVIQRLEQESEGVERLNNILAESAISIIGEQYIGYEIEAQVKGIVNEYIQQPFEGREDEQCQLDEFVQHSSRGVLLVTGAAGFGKSALLSHWQESQQEDCFIAYHCFSYRYQKTRLVSEAYRHLLKQLYLYHNIRNGQFPTDPNQMRDILVGMLEKPVSPEGKRLVIVLDGLDEASETLEPFFTRLADGVFVIASARAEVGDEPEYLRNWTDNAQRLYLKRLRREAIPKWLAQISELVTYSQNQDFVQRLDEITGGFPLYLRYLIDDLRQAAIKCQDVQGVLRNSPGGFKAYVKEQFRQLAKVEEIKRQGEVRELFALLSVALGALSEDDIEALTALNAWDLADLPWQATRWFSIQTGCYSSDFSRHPEKSISNLTPQPPSHPSRSPLQGEMAKDASLFFARKGENSKQGKGENSKPLSLQERGLERGFPDSVKSKNYSFAHPLLAQEFKGALGRQASLAEDKLIDYCAKWQDNHSSYGLRHYAEHLGKAKRWEELYAIARDKNFSSAQQQQLSDEPDLPLKTVQAALLGAAEEDKAERMAEFVLVHAHRLGQTNAQESPLDALRSGSLKRAWILADQYEIECCILWYLLLAWELKDEEKLDEARETLDKLEKKELPHFLVNWDARWQGDYAAYFLAYIFIQNKDICSIKDICTVIVQQILEEYHRITLYRIFSNYGNLDAIREIAVSQAEASEFIKHTNARKTTEEIENRGRQYSNLLTQAEEYAKAENFTDLRQIVEEVEKIYGWTQLEALGLIAKKLAEDGQPREARSTFAAALKLAQEAEAEFLKALALADVAEVQVKIEQQEEGIVTASIAHQIAQSIKNHRKKERVIITAQIAEVLTKAGKRENAKAIFDSAIEIAQSIETQDGRVNSFTIVAKARVRAKEYPDARKTAQRIEFLWSKAEVFGIIAKAEAEDGKDEAKTTLLMASEIAEGHSLDWVNALCTIALAQAVIDEEAALATFKELLVSAKKLLRERDIYLSKIAAAQAQAGEISHALETTDEIEDESELVKALSWIALTQFKKGKKQELLKTLTAALQAKDKIEDKQKLIKALKAIAGIQVMAGKGEEAVKTAEKILTERKLYLPGIASWLVETGDRENFKRLLIPCAYYLHTAYQMCGCLAKLYPVQATDIAKVVKEFTVSPT
ncbi:MAG: AAA family ATPase [Coleofasciculus sp. D1-CHI-01]|uniref:AAA family ATPase n=1 Tax=Coleofasciculus sp. D1-CHI-01 TaxID=3068482 RepID=UPI0032F3B44C